MPITTGPKGINQTPPAHVIMKMIKKNQKNPFRLPRRRRFLANRYERVPAMISAVMNPAATTMMSPL
jgi:hypothetical protein